MKQCVLLHAAVYVFSGGEIWQRVNMDIMNVCVCLCVCVSHNRGYYSNEVPGCLDSYCSPPVSHFPRDRGVCVNVWELV